MNIRTRLVHPPRIPGEPARAVSTPIYQTATFEQQLDEGGGRWDYSRSGNPTRDILESQLAALDGATRAFAFNSGMAAVSATLRLLQSGDELVVGEDLYGGTNRILLDLAPRTGVVVRFVDTRNLDEIARAITWHTKLVFIETPTNPRLRVADIAAIADLAHARGATLAVDNSMLSPLLQKPLELGADIALQSGTKLLGGHSDLTAGVLAVRDERLAERLAFVQNCDGTALAPFDSWLLLRGLETLEVRLSRQQASAQRLADWLARRPDLKAVHYPGLPGHAGAYTHYRQAAGPGVVLSIEVGSTTRARQLAERARLFNTVVSFGSVSSSICIPGAMSHASIAPAERAKRGISDDLVRISVGVEDVADLIADLDQALREDGAAAPTTRPARSLVGKVGSKGKAEVA